MVVKVKKLSDSAIVPSYAKRGDAGLDLTATSYKFENGMHVYGTSLAFEIPYGFVGLIYPRSSICKYDLMLSNHVGVVDSGYRGEVKFMFRATKEDPKIYNVGDRIGQLVIMPHPKIDLVTTTQLNDSDRGSGGFGSSGS